MNQTPASFDPAQRRANVRRTVVAVVCVIVLIYAGFFVRAVLLS
ncbi:hypothetical protein DFR29_111174 [Tahibacter aquaticus]|jgi:hypothetical protein|uniref:Uncharacterized protein n=1 Tax=Tahibacter aquaticus TaxID=520092 RepID=A0A4R6YSR7_9GAMM|nr:hypothetical protein [Tahibacter aquaticus]TDR41260.1 hypothetical protein DFR29_111174 [Tahibacter aquaticus]